MTGIRNGLLLLLFASLTLSSGLAQDGEATSRTRAQETLREVLAEAGVDAERVEATIRAMGEAGWAGISPEGVESILPALGYAQREGVLPENPERFGEYARSLARNGSDLTRLGFTSREAARTLASEVRRERTLRGVGRGSRSESPPGQELRRAQRERLREESRERARGKAGERSPGPGIVPGAPAQKPASPPGLDGKERSKPKELPETPPR